MRIGIPKEVKAQEHRIALTPEAVQGLVEAGHSVAVEHCAGEAVGYDDAHYQAAGARIETDQAAIWESCQLVIKVKEPQPDETRFLREDLILFCYLHLAPEPTLTQALRDAGTAAIAYETVTDPQGGLPLLAPMSRIAGRLAPQAGAHALEMAQGGRGVLLGGVPGVPAAEVVIVGAGNVGLNAARVALGMGASVTLFDIQVERLAQAEMLFSGRTRTCLYESASLHAALARADLTIGALLLPGARATRVIPRRWLADLPRGAVLVDVAIDQGGVAETSRPTTHAEPTFVADGVVHYCVANMPSAVARTATQALSGAVFPHALLLAREGLSVLLNQPNLRDGLQTCAGHITHAALAHDLGLDYTPPLDALSRISTH